jgi:hypothetical protein
MLQLLLFCVVAVTGTWANVHSDNLVVTQKPCPAGDDCTFPSYHLKFFNHLAKHWVITFTLNDVLPVSDKLTETYHVTGSTRREHMDGIYRTTTPFHVTIPEHVDFDWDVTPVLTEAEMDPSPNDEVSSEVTGEDNRLLTETDDHDLSWQPFEE